MGYYLELGPEIPVRNRVNGQFNKGAAAWNKGMTWKEMGISNDVQSRMRANLTLGRKGRPDLGGWNKIEVVALDDDGNIIAWFESASDAEKKTGISKRNINHCCHGKRKHVGGYRWKFFSEI